MRNLGNLETDHLMEKQSLSPGLSSKFWVPQEGKRYLLVGERIPLVPFSSVSEPKLHVRESVSLELSPLVSITCFLREGGF